MKKKRPLGKKGDGRLSNKALSERFAPDLKEFAKRAAAKVFDVDFAKIYLRDAEPHEQVESVDWMCYLMGPVSYTHLTLPTNSRV